MLEDRGFNYKLRSNKILKLIFSIAIMNLVFMFMGNSTKTYAQEKENNIIILLDNSLSMKTLGLDKLSKIAANMFLDSVNDNINVGIITFGTETTVLNKIKDKNDIEELKNTLNKVSFDESYTNMKDGIKKSIEELNTVEGKKTIIILSDGREDILGGVTESHFDEMNNLIKEAEESNIIVHAIALSDNIEKEYLTKISDNTNGSFRDGKTANKLFEALTSIIGVENDFITVANYSTSTNKSEKIKLSNMIEEAVINVAACDNIEPQISVKLNGKEISPIKSGDLYEIYKFENFEQSEIEISSLAESNVSVIVQLKSKAKLNIKSNSNNYLSIPMNIPIEYELELQCEDNQIPEGTFVERKGAKLDYHDQRNIFVDVYEAKEPGEDYIIYKVKDGTGGIIAMAELAISVNDYPSFYYDNPISSIVKGDKLSVAIIPKDKTEVSELGGMLIIKDGENIQEIPLVSYNNKLTAEAEINTVGEINYYVCLRGVEVESNTDFEYNLPMQSLHVKNRPNIALNIKNYDIKNMALGNRETIVINILSESVIPEDTNINIYDSSNNKIGDFIVKKGLIGDVKVEIEPIEKCDELILSFKCDNGYDITENLKTGIKVVSKLGFILDKYIKPIIIVILILLIIGSTLIAIYLYGVNIYKKNIEDFSEGISITYDISPRQSGTCEAEISNRSPAIYINYNKQTNKLSLDEELDNVIGIFEYKNKYEDSMKWYQGLMWKITKGNIIKINYNRQAEEEVYYEGELIEENIEYKNGVKIIYKMNKKEIEIQI